MGAYAKILLPKIKELSMDKNVVLDGLYSWDEYKILLDNLDNIYLVAIICDKEIRYERLEKREIRPLTSDEANKRDIAEIENLAKGGPISFADYFISNNGTLKDYEIRLKEILNDIEKERI